MTIANIADIEQALVDLLLPVGTALTARVEALPENWEQVQGKPLAHNHIWVSWESKLHTATASATASAQTIEHTVVVRMGSTKLRTHRGLYALMTAVESRLNGATILGNNQKLTVESSRVVGLKEGTWGGEVKVSYREWAVVGCS